MQPSFWTFPDDDGNPSPSVLSHLRRSIEVSKLQQEFPCFINPDSGALFPLARYYYRYLTYDDAQAFYDMQDHSEHLDTPIIPVDIPLLPDLLRKEHDFERIQKQTDKQDGFL